MEMAATKTVMLSQIGSVKEVTPLLLIAESA